MLAEGAILAAGAATGRAEAEMTGTEGVAEVLAVSEVAAFKTGAGTVTV